MPPPNAEFRDGDGTAVGPAGDLGATRHPGYLTPTGQPCPRSVRADGSVEGGGHCHGCGYCLGLQWAAWS